MARELPIMHAECVNCRNGHALPCLRTWTTADYRYVCGCDCPTDDDPLAGLAPEELPSNWRTFGH